MVDFHRDVGMQGAHHLWFEGRIVDDPSRSYVYNSPDDNSWRTILIHGIGWPDNTLQVLPLRCLAPHRSMRRHYCRYTQPMYCYAQKPKRPEVRPAVMPALGPAVIPSSQSSSQSDDSGMVDEQPDQQSPPLWSELLSANDDDPDALFDSDSDGDQARKSKKKNASVAPESKDPDEDTSDDEDASEDEYGMGKAPSEASSTASSKTSGKKKKSKAKAGKTYGQTYGQKPS